MIIITVHSSISALFYFIFKTVSHLSVILNAYLTYEEEKRQQDVHFL